MKEEEEEWFEVNSRDGDIAEKDILETKRRKLSLGILLSPICLERALEAIVRNPCITDIDLGYLTIEDKQIVPIVRLLHEKKELVRLDLDGNYLTSASLPLLLTTLQGNTTLESLSLSNNNFWVEDISIFLGGLERLPRKSNLKHVTCFLQFPDTLARMRQGVEHLASVNPLLESLALGCFRPFPGPPNSEYSDNFRDVFAFHRALRANIKLLLFLPVCPLDPVERFT